MQVIPLSPNAYSDNAYGVPILPLENWFAEAAPDNPGRNFRLLPTPGLTSFATGLTGAVRGGVQADGLLGGDMIVCAGTRVHRITEAGASSLIPGVITGTDKARFAVSQSDMIMTAGGSAYTVTADEVASFTWTGPGGDIIDVASIAQRHIYLEAGSGRFWWSKTADPTNIEGTAFATNESDPDDLFAVRVYGDLVWFYGTKTTELWYYTGDVEAPFAKRAGGTIQKGVIGRDAIAEADFGLFAVGDDRILYRVGSNGAQKVSSAAIDRLIESVSAANQPSIALTAHYYGGHAFIGLHLPEVGDYFFDVSTSQWHRRKEISNARHLADKFVPAWGRYYAGNRTAGTLYSLSRDVYTHDGAEVRRVARAIVPVEEGVHDIENAVVDIQAGVATADETDPQVMFRVAFDGRSFSPEQQESFGKVGEYDKQPIFDVGVVEPPVVVLEVAVTDKVGATVSGLKLGVDL